MFQSIKENVGEFCLLPKTARYFIYLIILSLLAGVSFFGIQSAISDHKIKTLEKMNSQLEKAAVTAQDRAKSAELNAANENLRSQNLEGQLKELQSQTKTQDENLQKQSAKINTIHNSITTLRRSQPKPVSASSLERRLKARYGQAKSN